MDLDLTAEQQQLVDAVHGLLAGKCSTDVVRAAEPGGFDRALWTAVCGLAGPATGVPLEQGGDGASLLDLELISEQMGGYLAPVPFIDGAVAARALAMVGDQGKDSLDTLLAEPATVSTVALSPAVDGWVRLAPSGAIAAVLVAMDDGDLVVTGGRPEVRERRNLGSSPLADRSVREGDRSVLVSGTAAQAEFALARDEWRVLMSGALVGLGEAAIVLGVEYAKNRHQFGVPIGSFQSIARDLADVATAIDGARLLAR